MRILDVEQGSPEWLAVRRGIPTASDFDEIVTAAKGDLAAAHEGAIARLIDERVRPHAEPAFAGNRHTERGKELEPAARDAYQFLAGLQVVQVGFVLRDDGRAGCSPDGLISSNGEFVGGLEIKCPDGPTHVAWIRGGVLPAKHRQQVHGSLAITDLRFWDFFSYCPGYVPFTCRVFRDAYTDKLAATLDEFLRRLDDARVEFGVCA
jgi:hypothetical protein